MALQLKLLATAGVENVPDRPGYLSLVSEQLDNTKIRKDVLTAVKVRFFPFSLSFFTDFFFLDVKRNVCVCVLVL